MGRLPTRCNVLVCVAITKNYFFMTDNSREIANRGTDLMVHSYTDKMICAIYTVTLRVQFPSLKSSENADTGLADPVPGHLTACLFHFA